MKQFHTLVLVAFSALLFFGCGGAVAPTTVPPTAPATLTSPTTAPTTVPPTVPPTQPPTIAPTASEANADKIVRDAFAKFSAAQNFRLDANAELSPLFFQGEYTPAPGDDPNVVNLFTLIGGQNASSKQYAVTGFIASLIAVFSGLDPNRGELEMIQIGDDQYLRGNLENETAVNWYKVPPEDAANSVFSPQEMLLPMTEPEYADGAFTKSESVSIGGQTCEVFTGNRAAFDAVFQKLASDAFFNPETLVLENVDRAEYKVVVCPDGNLYRVDYNFDAHAKADATKQGSFTLDAKLSDYASTISVQAPADALPMPTVSAPSAATREPTKVITQSFNSLEGEWEGTNGEDNPFSFTVSDNKITFASVNYFVGSGSCSFSGLIGNSVDDAPIEKDAFTFTLTNSDDVKFIVTGKFESNNAASGTLQIKGKTFCGDTDAKSDWTARHISSPDSANVEPTAEATVEATAEATAEPQATDESLAEGGGAIVQAVFDALAQNDVNGAMQYFDENVVYNIAGNSGIGADTLRQNLQLASTVGTTFAVSNIQELGGIVQFTVTVSGFGAGTYPNSSVIVEDGKIAILTIK